MAFHELHMMFPVEVLVDEGAKVADWGLGDIDMLGAMDRVDVANSWDGGSDVCGVG